MTKTEINELRKYYKICSDVSDERIKDDLSYSLGLSIVRIEIAKKNLLNAFGKSLLS